MRSRTIWIALTVLCTAVLGCAQVGSEEQKAQKAQEAMKAMEEAWTKAAEPGMHHAHLEALAGSWKQEVKWWMDPTKEPSISHGTAEKKMIMGERYLQEEVSGQMMESPFQGFGVTGYDNLKHKYASMWIDSMSSGIMTSEGTCDGSGKTFTFMGSYLDAVTGGMKTARSVTRIVDANKHIFEMYDKGPDGKEFKALEITYTRM